MAFPDPSPYSSVEEPSPVSRLPPRYQPETVSRFSNPGDLQKLTKGIPAATKHASFIHERSHVARMTDRIHTSMVLIDEQYKEAPFYAIGISQDGTSFIRSVPALLLAD